VRELFERREGLVAGRKRVLFADAYDMYMSATIMTQRNNPTLVGVAVPRGSDSFVISIMAPDGGPAKHANLGQVARGARCYVA